MLYFENESWSPVAVQNVHAQRGAIYLTIIKSYQDTNNDPNVRSEDCHTWNTFDAL
jgi:hypothetical protein